MNEIATTSFSKEQIDLIRRTIAVGASDDELRLFLYQAGRVGLDPLSRQIFAVKRWNSALRKEVMTIQTSIDGFRLIAQRSGKYAGQSGPFWCGPDGEWRDAWTEDAPPMAAKVGALRSDFKEPCWGVARFSSYAQKTKEGKLTHIWQTMGDLMTAKCAEALALRKAFPQELSGIYSGDEMEQTSTDDPTLEIETAPARHPAIEPHQLSVPQLANNAGTDWRTFGTELTKILRACETKAEVFTWLEKNRHQLAEMAELMPKMFKSLNETIEEIKNEPS